MNKLGVFLTAAIVLMSSTIAGADPILTVNGLDTTNLLEIRGKESLVIAIAGQSDAKTQDIYITCNAGKIRPLTKSNEQVRPGYLFGFTDKSKAGTVNLNAGKDVVYRLVLFCIPPTDTVIVFGLDKEALVSQQPRAASGPEQSEQQTSTSQATEPEKSYLASSSGGRTIELDTFPDPDSYPDFNDDKIVNFFDLVVLAENWQKSGSGLDGDIDNSGAVDADDLATFAYFWLNGPHPLDVFESFKTALTAGDVNEALTSIAEISREKYAEIFSTIEPHLSDYAAGMGEMTFDRQRPGEVIYEMLHQDGPETLSFPVFFIRDEDGKWRIFKL